MKKMLLLLAATLLAAGCAQVPTSESSVMTAKATAQHATDGYRLQSVDFDASTGTGFVGKGDVQSAFGWNNAQLQSNAAGVTFSYESVQTYLATYEWTTGEGKKGQKTHTIEVPRRAQVKTAVAFNARTHKQIDGFTLTGLSATSSQGGVPVVGSHFNDGNDQKICVDVQLLSSTGGFFVNFNNQSVQLQ